ncbi:hypothetical protein [Rhizobium altiplani]|nr:hypothetical protein [Rhizobium altiplani]
MSEKAIVYATSAPPEGIEWLTASTSEQIGTSFEAVKAQAPATGPQ